MQLSVPIMHNLTNGTLVVNKIKSVGIVETVHIRSQNVLQKKWCVSLAVGKERKGKERKGKLNSTNNNNQSQISAASMQFPSIPWLDDSTLAKSLHKSILTVYINGEKVNALVDSGSTDNFIHPRVVKQLSLSTFPTTNKVLLASPSQSKSVTEFTVVDTIIKDKLYENMKLYVLKNLCWYHSWSSVSEATSKSNL